MSGSEAEAASVRLGWCAPLAKADMLARIGFDYIELPLAAQGFEGEGAPWRASLAAARAAPLPVRAFNYFLPQDMRIVGEDVDNARLDTYLGRAAEFMAGVGATAAVMGAAWSRNVPEGFDRSRAEDQLVAAFVRAAGHLAGTGVTLVIEPLYRVESNIINSVAEAVAIARRVGRTEIQVLADFFHMDEEREPLETLAENRAWVRHIHLADTARLNPGSGTYPYDRFMGILARTGYRGLMSAECRTRNEEADMRASLAFLRRYWPRA